MFSKQAYFIFYGNNARTGVYQVLAKVYLFVFGAIRCKCSGRFFCGYGRGLVYSNNVTSCT